MFVEWPGEVDIEELLVLDGKAHHPPRKLEVTQVVRIHVWQAVWLKSGTYDDRNRT